MLDLSDWTKAVLIRKFNERNALRQDPGWKDKQGRPVKAERGGVFQVDGGSEAAAQALQRWSFLPEEIYTELVEFVEGKKKGDKLLADDLVMFPDVPVKKPARQALLSALVQAGVLSEEKSGWFSFTQPEQLRKEGFRLSSIPALAQDDRYKPFAPFDAKLVEKLRPLAGGIAM